MNKLMKIFIVLALMIPMFGVGGCQISVKPPTTQQSALNDAKLQHSATIATGVYLLTIDSKAERAKTALAIRNIATQVKAYEFSSLADLRLFASNLIQTSNVDKKEVITLLLNSVSVLVEDQLGTVTVTPKVEVKNTVNAAIDGIIEATNLYGN